jgi:hypothetical protein
LPHPLLLDPPVSAAAAAPRSPADPVCFELTLFGRAAEHLPHLVVALEQMARRGLGRERRPFELASVAQLSSDGSTAKVYRPGEPLGSAELEPLGRYLRRQASPTLATIALLTPTRIASGGRLTRTPSFADLVRSLATRALAMAHYHSGADVDLDLVGLVEAARAARVVASDLRLERLRRRSSRQEALVPLDGMVGTITYEGQILAELWPLLEAGQILHVGKGTVFGCGRCEVLPAAGSGFEGTR